MTGNNNEQTTNFFDQVLTEYNEGNKRYKTSFLNVMKHYYYFQEACFRKGEISVKGKYFLALAISIVKHDEYHIVHYIKKAIENGATEQEIMELISICIALDGNSSLSQGVTLVLEAFDYFHQNTSSSNQNQNTDQNQSTSQQNKNQQSDSNQQDSKQNKDSPQQNKNSKQQNNDSDQKQSSNNGKTEKQQSNENNN